MSIPISASAPFYKSPTFQHNERLQSIVNSPGALFGVDCVANRPATTHPLLQNPISFPISATAYVPSPINIFTGLIHSASHLSHLLSVKTHLSDLDYYIKSEPTSIFPSTSVLTYLPRTGVCIPLKAWHVIRTLFCDPSQQRIEDVAKLVADATGTNDGERLLHVVEEIVEDLAVPRERHCHWNGQVCKPIPEKETKLDEDAFNGNTDTLVERRTADGVDSYQTSSINGSPQKRKRTEEMGQDHAHDLVRKGSRPHGPDPDSSNCGFCNIDFPTSIKPERPEGVRAVDDLRDPRNPSLSSLTEDETGEMGVFRRAALPVPIPLHVFKLDLSTPSSNTWRCHLPPKSSLFEGPLLLRNALEAAQRKAMSGKGTEQQAAMAEVRRLQGEINRYVEQFKKAYDKGNSKWRGCQNREQRSKDEEIENVSKVSDRKNIWVWLSEFLAWAVEFLPNKHRHNLAELVEGVYAGRQIAATGKDTNTSAQDTIIAVDGTLLPSTDQQDREMEDLWATEISPLIEAMEKLYGNESAEQVGLHAVKLYVEMINAGMTRKQSLKAIQSLIKQEIQERRRLAESSIEPSQDGRNVKAAKAQTPQRMGGNTGASQGTAQSPDKEHATQPQTLEGRTSETIEKERVKRAKTNGLICQYNESITLRARRKANRINIKHTRRPSLGTYCSQRQLSAEKQQRIFEVARKHEQDHDQLMTLEGETQHQPQPEQNGQQRDFEEQNEQDLQTANFTVISRRRWRGVREWLEQTEGDLGELERDISSSESTEKRHRSQTEWDLTANLRSPSL
ncbi:MAG: hypothetical protein Q9227_006514 [Pyrenula ochraceoflavens]